MRNIHILFVLLVLTACVKDESNVTAGSNVGTTTGTTGGGEEVVSPGADDPLASQAWHLKNSGQSSFSDSNAVLNQDIKLENVHLAYNIRGRNVRIAVSDTGTELEHQDLFPNTLPGEHRNYTFESSSKWPNSSPHPSEDDAHGTAVSGLISAVGWNGIGSRGVAPESKFAAFRYIYSPNDSSTTSKLAKEIDQYYGDFDIFNYSYGHTGYYFVPTDPLAIEAVKLGTSTLRNGKGAIYVQAAGNSFEEFYKLCDSNGINCTTVNVSGNANAHESLSSPYKIVVGAVNASGKRSSYSTPGSNLWVSAPGGEDGLFKPAMVTTDIRGCNAGYSFRHENLSQYFDFGFLSLNPRCDYTAQMNGTSSATPVTSGVVALMLEANPNLTWRDVKHILALTSTRIDYTTPFEVLPHPKGENPFGLSYQYDYKWIENAAGRWFSNWYGFGRINADAAVSMAMSYNPSTLGFFEETKNTSGTWYYDSGPISEVINDESTIPAQSSIWVGHNYVIESVQIQITTNHARPGDLAIHLVSPSGTESRLMTLNNNIYSVGLDANFTMASNAFYGENSSGTWTIKVYDGKALITGTLQNWKILVSGHRKSSELADPYPPTFLSLGATANPDTETPQFSFSDSILPVSFYEAAVGTNPYSENVRTWSNIGTSTSSHVLTGLSLTNGVQYYLKVRARHGTRVSSQQVIPWTPSF